MYSHSDVVTSAVEQEESTAFLRIVLFLALFLLPAIAGAEQLPVRTYTTADGLPRDYINRIYKDSRGFLWFCTWDGLSRFNGYEFITYGVEAGLADPRVNDMVETRDGVYWVATNGGVCRFNPAAAPQSETSSGASSWASSLFTVYPVGDEPATNRVNILYEDRSGQLWAGTDAGLFRLDQAGGRATFRGVELNLLEPDRIVVVHGLVEDQEGSLWVSTDWGLVRRLPGGRMVRYALQSSQRGEFFSSLMCDSEGRLWVGHWNGGGLIVFKPEPVASVAERDKLLTPAPPQHRPSARSPDQHVRLPASAGDVCQYTIADGLASNSVQQGIYQSSDGRIWIGTVGGLTEFSNGRFQSYTMAQGLSNRSVWPQVEDPGGNLWLASPTGAMKITWSGFTTFGKADGLGTTRVTSIFENRRGELCVTSNEVEDGPFLNRFDGRRFMAVWPQFPSEIKGSGWGSNQITFQDHTGEWWVPTGFGLCRFPRVMSVEQLAHTRPRAVYNHKRGELPGIDVFRLFEDSHGDIWISIASNVRNAVVRWERATESFHLYSDADGLPPLSPATAYCEDAYGNLWLGFYDGGLARYRDGCFKLFTHSDGIPAGLVRALHLDEAGRLWAATSRGGVVRLDDPQADRPRVVGYTIADGLSSNSVSCITEDKLGRMYFGTARSLDQLDPRTGRVRHYTRADGLAANAVSAAFRDRQGVLWFGSDQGLSRLVPGPDLPRSEPPIMISGLRIAGESYPISALGETEVSGLVLNPGRNQLSIDFVGLGLAAGEGLRYQYRFGDSDWSALTDQRTINYASLPPGKYRFAVRAVTADGSISPAPATISFAILPPIWRSWWFVTLAAMAVVMVVFVVYRYRVSRLIELERVRTRIAADLHDDIGSGLSRIAILSEVARHQLGEDDSPVRAPLVSISRASRDLVDAMSDIVWAINPNRDQLSDLTRRMRRFASDIFTARQIEFVFGAPGQEQDLTVGADVRRQVFLIFKEAVNNIARHSACTEVEIELRIDRRWLLLKLADNGRGFDPAEVSEGQGLTNMRVRAQKLGGEIQISSTGRLGTTVTFSAPVSAKADRRAGGVR